MAKCGPEAPNSALTFVRVIEERKTQKASPPLESEFFQRIMWTKLSDPTGEKADFGLFWAKMWLCMKPVERYHGAKNESREE